MTAAKVETTEEPGVFKLIFGDRSASSRGTDFRLMGTYELRCLQESITKALKAPAWQGTGAGCTVVVDSVGTVVAKISGKKHAFVTSCFAPGRSTHILSNKGEVVGIELESAKYLTNFAWQRHPEREGLLDALRDVLDHWFSLPEDQRPEHYEVRA